MPHVHLPAQHTDDDLALAGALATMLRSKELYVAWSVESGQAAPVIAAALQDVDDELPPVRRRRGFLADSLSRQYRRREHPLSDAGVLQGIACRRQDRFREGRVDRRVARFAGVQPDRCAA